MMSFKLSAVLAAAAAIGCAAAGPRSEEVALQSLNSAEALLDRVEASAADLRTFTADLRYDKYDAVDERSEIRLGRDVYDASDGARKRIGVLFNLLAAPVRKEINVRYAFDGSWFVEADADAKRFDKRQIVAPGETFDPLKLGEGPLPLPIGQKKADVLARFDVETIELPTTEPLKRLTNVQGIRLTPKPGTPEAKAFLHVDVFYDNDTLLPVGINAVGVKLIDPADESSRDRKTIWLTNVLRNSSLGEDEEALLSVVLPDPKSGWQVEVKPWGEE